MGALTEVAEIKAAINERLTNAPRIPIPGFGACKPPVKPMVCADGFTVSVQASSGNYCAPRDDRGPWAMVELGYPSAPMPEMAQWCEDTDPNATKTVWGYVPLGDVADLIARHGGLVREWSAA